LKCSTVIKNFLILQAFYQLCDYGKFLKERKVDRALYGDKALENFKKKSPSELAVQDSIWNNPFQ